MGAILHRAGGTLNGSLEPGTSGRTDRPDTGPPPVDGRTVWLHSRYTGLRPDSSPRTTILAAWARCLAGLAPPAHGAQAQCEQRRRDRPRSDQNRQLERLPAAEHEHAGRNHHEHGERGERDRDLESLLGVPRRPRERSRRDAALAGESERALDRPADELAHF